MLDVKWSDFFSDILEEVDGIVRFKESPAISIKYKHDYEVREIRAGGRAVELFWPRRGNIIIQVSGGADSASLLFQLAKIAKQERIQRKIFPLTYKRDKPHNLISAPNVIRWIEDRLEYKFGKHIIIDEGPEDAGWVKRIVKRVNILREENGVTQEFDAITALPGFPGEIPHEAQRDLNNSMYGIKNRSESIQERLTNLGHQAVYHYITKPYWLVDKKFISALYFENQHLDLLPYTRSCESLPADNENFKYTCLSSQTLQEKNSMCWWCVERKWAFREYLKANYSDFIREYP